MSSQIESRLNEIPASMRASLIEARRQRGWSQAELGKRMGLPQTHISAIETGRVVPRFDTLLELVRILGFDLMLVPRQLLPVVDALVRQQRRLSRGEEIEDDEPLYALKEDEADPS
jgi:HTH-type transcriptional regulator / antitoxin HipB